MKVILSFIFIFSFSVSFSQVLTEKEKAKKMKTADELFAYQDYNKALKLYQELYQTDSANGNLSYKIGVSMYNLRQHKELSLPYLKKANKAGVKEASYYLGNLYHLNMEFDKAIESYQSAKQEKALPNVNDSLLNHLINTSMYANKMMAKKNNITIENMGETINSPQPDYVPLISADESTLIFTSRRETSTGRLLDPNGEYFEDIFVSKKENGKWTTPVSISNKINTTGHDACVALSADGEQLIVYKTSEDLFSGDLYISNYNGKDWTAPVLLGSDINTEEGIEPSASISADNNSLYFSSNRPGGFGEKDIYRVVKLPDGKWSKATSLGSVINTRFDEDAPFIHPDGKTLYFSSKGHQNMGGYDIFKTVYDEDDRTWSVPENLGFPINTVDNDIYFVLSVDGKTGYYSSKKPSGVGETDIYKINMPDENFNLKAYSAMVLTEEGDPVVAKVMLTDNGSNELVGEYKTNKLTGKYLLVIDPSKQYKVTIHADGFTPFTGDAYLSEQPFIVKMKPAKSN